MWRATEGLDEAVAGPILRWRRGSEAVEGDGGSMPAERRQRESTPSLATSNLTSTIHSQLSHISSRVSTMLSRFWHVLS